MKEYNPQTHDVMHRPNKYRDKGKDVYITEKLPRTRQRYINDVELFFMLGRPIKWMKEEGDDEAFLLFKQFLYDKHFDSRIRQAKRLAGAETESAMICHIYRDDETGEKCVNLNVLARSNGHRLRTLFDSYGNLVAFAYGYKANEGGRSVQHWDFQTSKYFVFASKSSIGWAVEIYPNPTGKINAIYFNQPKAWDGAERRIAREEMLDSKTGDTNNYFSDPIAVATADVIQGLADPDKPGRLIRMTGDRSRFDYVNPPTSSQTREAEKRDLNKSILFDTYTPDFDTEAMRGFGSLSGVAIRNAMILGFIKRDNRLEVYDELIGRFASIVIAALKFLYPEKVEMLDKLVVRHEFAEPFGDDIYSERQSITALYSAGLISLETAVNRLRMTDEPEAEIERILADAAKKQEGEVTQPDTGKGENTMQSLF